MNETIIHCGQEVKPVNFGYGRVWACPICRKILKSVKIEGVKGSGG